MYSNHKLIINAICINILTYKIKKYLMQFEKEYSFLRIFLYFKKNNFGKGITHDDFSRKHDHEIALRNARTIKLKWPFACRHSLPSLRRSCTCNHMRSYPASVRESISRYFDNPA